MIESNNNYKRLFGRILIIVLIVAFSDIIIGSFLRHFYFCQKSGSGYRTTYAIDSTKADILIFGSSRANHHYVPDVFEDSLKMSFYNTGRDGNFLLYNYAVFKTILRRYTPKMVIFDISPNDLFYDLSSYDRLSSLLPYYKKHSEIRDVIKLRGSFEECKNISSIYPFNSYAITIAIGNLELNKSRKSDKKGYVPLYGTLKDIDLRDTDIKNEVLDTNSVNALKNIIFLCKENNISLILAQSPIYATVQKSYADDLIEKFAENYHIDYWNHATSNAFTQNPAYFQDIYHLNDVGARYYSLIIIEHIIKSAKLKKYVFK